jgi:hypothetical protein
MTAPKTSHAAAHAPAPRTSHAAAVGARPAPAPTQAQGESGPEALISSAKGEELGL